MIRILNSTVFFALTLAAGPAARAESPTINVRLASDGNTESAPSYAATVAPVRKATLSTRMAATVGKVLVTEGTQVKRGQLLLTLSDDDVRAQLSASETALANATAHERRIAELSAKRAATPVELEMAQAQRAQAAAAVAGTRATLAYTHLRAPFDGTVQSRRVNAGDFVGPGQPLLEIQGADLELQATLSDEEAGEARIGLRVPFTANGKAGTAEITALTVGGDALSHRRALRAKILDAASDLRSGTFARIQLPGSGKGRQRRIPNSALVRRGDLTGVFIAKEGQARLRWVSVGDASDVDVAVRAGLAPDDPVIDAPGNLRDGQPVEITYVR